MECGVGGSRSSLINVRNRSKRIPLRVIAVRPAWHPGCFFYERRSRCCWDGYEAGEWLSCGNLSLTVCVRRKLGSVEREGSLNSLF